MSPKILALIPAYNEANLIAEVITKTRQHLPVLVVDDGSRDETAAKAEAAGATVLRQNPNQGKGAALRRGFSYALENGYDAVLTLDADGQHDPAEAVKFIESFVETGADLIIGHRNFDQMPIVRRISNTFGTALFSWATGTSILDNQSGYRLLSRRMIETLLEGLEAGFEFEMEQIVVCMERGYQLGWVPIRTIYAGETSHIRPLHHVWNFVRVSLQTRKRLKRTVQ
ncbi:MAG: glycosyltransferase family 2 protein [Caldilineaceae bacterium]|nr:glycosyltransferase family 2 protein [Caldilineaceae bacterium]